ncbi:MAG: hypothetical protein IT443_13365 [Phycisphaeraceae bacterium]|nr:hypothetical protein [Phycisphaeraceae bacterium]
MMKSNRSLAMGLACVGLWTLALAGCARYQIEGLVAEGREPSLEVVKSDDPKLSDQERYGLAKAVIEITIDPNSGRPERLPPITTDDSGRFTLPISKTGMGMLEYKLGILVHRDGFSPQWRVIDPPGKNERLIILMQPGPSRGALEVDLLRQTLHEMPN